MNNIQRLAQPGKVLGLLSVKQAAAFLNMSEGWLYGSGIPHVKLGRRRLYRPSDLERFVEERLSVAKRRAE